MVFKSNRHFSGLILLDSFGHLALWASPSSLKPGFSEKTFSLLFRNPLTHLHPQPLSECWSCLGHHPLFSPVFHWPVLPSSSNLRCGLQLPPANLCSYLLTSPECQDCFSSCLWVSPVGWSKDSSIKHVPNQSPLTPFPLRSNIFPFLVNGITICQAVHVVRTSESAFTHPRLDSKF